MADDGRAIVDLDENALLARIDQEIGGLDAWLEQQHRDFRLHLSTIDKARSENRGRILLLSAGIVGIVVPLLAKEPLLVQSATLLKTASVCWLTSIAVGVLGQASDRITLARITKAFNVQAEMSYVARIKMRAAMATRQPVPTSDSPERRAEHDAIDALDRERLVRRRLADIEDVFVYGGFIVGVIILTWGLW